MTLEIPTNKEPGTEIRRTAAARPAIVGAFILGLTIIEFVFAGLVFTAMANGANRAGDYDPAIDSAPLNGLFLNEQTIISFWLACTFFCLFAIVLLYQRFYLDHVTIAKRRFRKWEDEGVQLHD